MNCSPEHLLTPLHIPSYSNTAVPKCRDVHDDGIQHHRGRERMDSHQNRPDPRLLDGKYPQELFPRHEIIYELHRSNEESQKEINRLRKKNEELTREIHYKHGDMEEEHNFFRRKVEEITRAIDEQHITYEELKRENAFLWKKNEKITNEIHDRHGEMEEENNCLQMKLEEMTRTVNEQHITVEELKKENAFLCKTNEEITRNAEKKTSVQGKCNCKIFKQEYVNEARIEKNKREEEENRECKLRAKYNSLQKEHATCPKKTPRISKSPNAKTKELSWEKWDSPEYQLKINEVKQELAGERANISKYQMEIKKVKDELSSERVNSKKYKLAYEELLEWKVKREERETRRANEYNAILENEMPKDLTCSMKAKATEKGKTAHSGKTSYKELIDRLEILNTTKTEELQKKSHELKKSEAKAQIMRDKLSGAESMIRELNEINQTLEHEKCELQKYRADNEKNLEDNAHTYKSNLEEKKQQNHLLEAQKKECENNLKGAQHQILRLQYEATEREELLNSLQKNVILLNKAKESAEEGQAQLQRQLKETNVQMQKMQERLLQCQSKDASEIATLQTQVDDLNKELNNKIDELNNTLTTLSNQQNESKMLKKQLNMTNDTLKFETEARKEEIKLKNRVVEEKITEKEHQLQQANEQLQNFTEETQNLKQELHQTKSKLSKLIGQRLTDDNPNITDLSEKNRPTKLAERYSELYDNEWTDAFEVLNAIYNDEQKTIAMLTDILKEAASFCRNEADEQMENLRKVLTLQNTMSESRVQEFPDLVNKQLKNSRKIMSEIAGQYVAETYIQRLQPMTSLSAHDALRVDTFLREAFSLCWLMSILDPPVVFDRLLQHGEKFNIELYRSFTKAGPLVDFTVWPTMFLHEGGPVLYKGVAQGCNK